MSQIEAPPPFFVPAASTEAEAEEVYRQFAHWCRRSIPEPAERIYSITFRHDGDVWTATVGERLTGRRVRTSRSKGRQTERVVRLSDPAVVLAIIPGNPYMVVTNHRLAGNVGSAWESPFMAGTPSSITYFRSQASEEL